jgi:hypothetical protein
LRKEILPAEKDQVRVVFRYFPLSMHAWARPAAEAAACAFQQRNEFFWSFHDFFFEHQSEITPGNLQQKVMEHAHGVQGLDAAKFQDCLSQPETKTGVDSAVAFAEQHGIEGTPTIFLNGRETPIVAPEQLRTLISQISKNPQAFAEMAAANPAPARRPELKTIPGLADGQSARDHRRVFGFSVPLLRTIRQHGAQRHSAHGGPECPHRLPVFPAPDALLGASRRRSRGLRLPAEE